MKELQTIRCLLAKNGEARFIGHLDLARAVERAARRAALPLAHTEGFNPRPRISFASALALGATSEGEVVDFTLREPVPVAEFLARLRPQMPPGLALLAAREVPAKGPSPAQLLRWSAYRLVLAGGPPALDWRAVVGGFLGSDECIVERAGKDGRPVLVDVVPLVRDLQLLEAEDGHAAVSVLLRAGGQDNLRPAELVQALAAFAGQPLTLKAVHRLGLFAEGPQGLVPLFEI